MLDAVKLLAGLVERSAPDEWYVTDGATAIGPVGLELLSRGITAGKVPPDAFVRHGSWSNWRRLSDLEERDPTFNPRKTLRVLRAAKNEPPRETLPSIDVIPDDEVIVDVEEVSPAGFERAADLQEALLMLLAAAVNQCGADAALIHGARGDGASVVCSHGTRMFEALGDRLLGGDPALFAARQGVTLLAELMPGNAGRAIKTRLSRLGTRVEAAFMVPIVVDGTLLASIEVGRIKPFRAREVGQVETLGDALVEAIGRSSWERAWKGAPRSVRT